MSGSLASLADFDPTTLPSSGDAPIVIDTGDVKVTIHTDDADDEDDDEGFYDNLAEKMDAVSLGAVASELLMEIQSDDQSRSEWLKTREQGITMLGLKIDEPRGDIGASQAPLEGMSTYRSPELLQAVLRAQAVARGELLPADGPVKITDLSGAPAANRDEMAELLEQKMNAYLTKVCPEYYPDTDNMLFWTAFGGVGFKKGYHCPLKRRPVLEYVDAANIICSPGSVELKSALRVTHKIMMKESDVKRLMASGHFRDAPLSQAAQDLDSMLEKRGDAMGLMTMPQRPQDMLRTLYEVNCERVIPDSRRPEGMPDDVPLPYRITIDKDSMTVLSWERRWDKDDPMAMGELDIIRYPYVEGMGIYAIGLVHIVGNATRALTAATREMLDAGMFANFPGFIYTEAIARQLTNEFRVPPGGGVKVQSPAGQPLSNHIQPLPYKDVSANLLKLTEAIQQDTKMLAGVAELPTGESSGQMPVGTALAIIDQATKPLDAVHKRLHAAQAEELQLLKRLLREDPEALTRSEDLHPWTADQVMTALKDFDLTPVSDPNIPTHTHRLLKGAVLKQLSTMSPQLYDAKAVDTHILHLLGFTDTDQFFAPPASPGSNPAEMQAQMEMQKAQAEVQKAQAGVQQAQVSAQAAQAKGESDIKLATIKGQQGEQKLSLDKAKAANEQQKIEADERLKKLEIGADMMKEGIKGHAEATVPPPLDPNNALQAQMQREGQAHEAQMGARDQAFQASEGDKARSHEASMGGAQMAHEESMGSKEMDFKASESRESREFEGRQATNQRRADSQSAAAEREHGASEAAKDRRAAARSKPKGSGK